MFSFVDMFSGIGGFHVAMAHRGGTCVFACDADPACRQMYEKNFGITCHPDIRAVKPEDVPDHDVLCAGFPCQAFSNAGKKRSTQDERGKLFDYLMAIIRAKRPPVVLLENVKHIRTIDEGRVFEHVLRSLEDTGYHVEPQDLSPEDLGAPQLRPRVFFRCHLRGAPLPSVRGGAYEHTFRFDEHVSDTYALGDDLVKAFDAWNAALPILRDYAKGTFPVYLDLFHVPRPDADARDWKSVLTRKNQDVYAFARDRWDQWMRDHTDILGRKDTFRKLEWQAGPLGPYASLWNQYIQLRPSGIRVKRATHFPTLVAMVQVPICGPRKRYLTPRECARLQSFPDSIELHPSDHTAYKQLGNAVNVACVLHAFDSMFK